MIRKIMSALASVAMISSTVALAAAANYPAPFVAGGAADVAVVYGASAAATDLVAVTDITANLQTKLAAQTATTSTTTGPSSGSDFISLDKSSDRLNINNRINAVRSTLNVDEMPGLLADGTYTANDNDEFSYEQKITLGSEQVTHFRDSDYEEQIGVSEKTPVVGVKFTSGKAVMNYTIDFLTDAETDYVSTSTSDLEDIEGSDLPLFGKKYYVSDAKNGTSATYFGTWTLLDSAKTAVVKEGETITVGVGSKTYDVSINYIDADSTSLTINGKSTKDNTEGLTEKLADGSYVGVRDVRKLAVAGEVGTVEFSIGSGKLEIASGSDIKLNDVAVTGVKGYVFRGTPSSGTTQKLDKITIEWKTDDEAFVTPGATLVMPGFGGLKLAMDKLVRSTEEEVHLEKDDDTSYKISVPVKDGTASFDVLYGNATSFTGIGKSATERLATSSTKDIVYFNQKSGDTWDKYMAVSYNTTKDSESYLLSFDVTEDTTNARNVTSIKNVVTGEEKTNNKKAGDTFTIGDVTLTINSVHKNSSDEWVNLTAGTDVNFHSIYTTGGLRIYLPYLGTAETGAINFTANFTDAASTTGHNPSSYYLYMDGEDKDDTIAGGTAFSFTLDQTSNGRFEVAAVNSSGGGAGKGSGGEFGLEKGSNTQIYEAYVKDDVAPRIVHYTKGDEDYVEVFYPTSDSQTYASIYAASEKAAVGTKAELGSVSVKDSEVASVATKNLIVVGGSCVNSVAADLLGSATPVCGDAWEAKTSVGAGQFLVQTFSRTGGKVATLVAGYNAGDTTNAAKYLTTAEAIDTTTGKKYVGTTATSAELVTA